MAPQTFDPPAANRLVPHVVSEKIADVIQRMRGNRISAAVVLTLAAACAVLLIAISVDWAFVLFEPAQRTQLTFAALCTMGVIAFVCVGIAITRRVTALEAAHQIDEQTPVLQERWASLTEFSTTRDTPALRGSEAFIRKVADEAAQLESLVQPKQILAGRDLHVAVRCLLGVSAIWIVALMVDPGQVTVLVRRFLDPQGSISLTQLNAESGDLVGPRGSNLKLEALVTGRLQPHAELSIRKQGVEDVKVVLEPLNADRTRFLFPIKDLQDSFAYRFRAGDGQTAWHQVTLAERPTLQLVDFQIVPPAYSKLPHFQQQGLPKSVKALQGSRLLLQFQASIPLSSFILQQENNTEHVLSADESRIYRWDVELQETIVFRPMLKSIEGLTNAQPSRCEIIVFRDQAPIVDVASPMTEIALRPDDTVTISFDAKDDLGIAHAELVVFDASKNGTEVLKTIPISLGDQVGGKSVHGQTDLDLAEFKLKHGEQLTYAIRVYDTKESSAIEQSGTLPQSPSEPIEAHDTSESRSSESARINHEPSTHIKTSPSSRLAGANSEQPDAPPSKSDQQSLTATRPDRSSNANKPESDAQTERDTRPKEQAGGGNRWTPKLTGSQKPDGQPQAEIGGAPRPDFFMAKHELDTPGGQRTSGSRRRIIIDEWAGSFTSQVLDKLQLQIDPILNSLRKALAEARNFLQPIADQGKATNQWQPGDSKAVRQSDALLDTSEQQVRDLTMKTDNTPYAFIGLQLQDIAQTHIHPARENLTDATLFDSPVKPDDLSSAVVHIQRAIELLEKLTREYDTVKLNQKLAETMTQIKKMHQIFLEGTFTLLTSQKPILNPKERAFMEQELTEEFLAKLEALMKKKLAIQTELAKVLSQDPRLLGRYMARTRLEASTLRDQLTMLNDRQQSLHDEVKAGLPAENAPQGKLVLKNRLLRRSKAAVDIAEETSQMFDNFVVWTPLALDVNKGRLASFKAQGLKLVSIATRLKNLAQAENAELAIQTGELFYEQLIAWRESLPELLDDETDLKMAVHVANRVQDTDKLITDVSGWVVKEKAIEGGDHHLAAEVDQHRITVDTVALARKLKGLNAQCQGISVKLGEAANAFLTTMNDDLVAELELSQDLLDDNDLRKAVHHQSLAVAHFERAERQLDEVMDGIIKHLDSLPFDPKPEMPDDVQPESLDALLAMLDEEARAAETLGIPNRPSNLNVERDWITPGGNLGGGGTGGSGRRSLQSKAQMAQSRLANQDAEQLRKQLENSLKKMMKAKSSEDRMTTGVKAERKWDTLGSKLEEHVRQGRGNLPPEQYRRAIELYFESLAGKHRPGSAEN